MKEIDSRPEKLSWAATIFGVLALICTIAIGRRADLTTLLPATLSSLVLTFMALLAAGRVRLLRREFAEEEALADHRRNFAKSELFEDADDALRTARRNSEIYVKYVVPALGLLIGIAVVVAVVISWKSWSTRAFFPLTQQPGKYGVLILGLSVLHLIAGSYFNGASREPQARWLRPAGAWMFLSALFFGFAALVLLAEHVAFRPQLADAFMARAGLVVAGILGVELVLNFVVEFYRPRTAQEERPIFESRLLSLFTEPGGIARNVATSLDYQFGFQVSEFWFYRFLEKRLIPFGFAMVFFIWLLTTMTVVRPEENGIRERLGKVVKTEPLLSGFYFKLPWPFETIYKFPVHKVQVLPVGYKPVGSNYEADPGVPEDMQGDKSGRVIVWSKKHNAHETDFIVASEAISEVMQPVPEGTDLPVPVYFMAASIPLYFKVNNLYDYHYRHRDPILTLEEIATREVVRYLAHVDFFQILTTGGTEGAEELRSRIKSAADDVALGIDVVFVGLQGIHPPVQVGDAFDNVVVAMEEKHVKILDAEKDAIRMKPDAEAKAVHTVSIAKAYRAQRGILPKAEANRFQQQLLAYNASPQLFVLRNFLDVLENEGKDIRKYIVTSGKSSEVFILNLEKKLRADLFDIDLDRKDY